MATPAATWKWYDHPFHSFLIPLLFFFNLYLVHVYLLYMCVCVCVCLIIITTSYDDLVVMQWYLLKAGCSIYGGPVFICALRYVLHMHVIWWCQLDVNVVSSLLVCFLYMLLFHLSVSSSSQEIAKCYPSSSCPP